MAGPRNSSASAAATWGSVPTNGTSTSGSSGLPAPMARLDPYWLQDTRKPSSAAAASVGRSDGEVTHAKRAKRAGAAGPRHLLELGQVGPNPRDQDDDDVREDEYEMREDQPGRGAGEPEADEPVGQARAGRVGGHQERQR